MPSFLINMLSENYKVSMGKYVISKTDGFVEPRGLQCRFKSLLNQAGLKLVGFQTMRHTFAVRALENNFDVVALSKIMGHATPFVTYNRYATMINEENRIRKSMEYLAKASLG